MEGSLSTNVGHHGWSTKKNLKMTLAKTPLNQSQKAKFAPENNWFKTSYLIIIFLISDFLAESPKANKNWQKRPVILQYSFTQKSSLIAQTSTHSALKNIYSRNTVKNPLTLQIF